MSSPARRVEYPRIEPIPAPQIELPSKPGRGELPPPRPATKSEAQPEPVADSGALAVEVVRDLAALRAIESTWQDLADEAVEPNPFYEPWAALPALAAFGQDVEVVLVYRAHPSRRKGERQLCGLFPVNRRRSTGPLAIPMLSLWRHPYSYLGVPLVRSGLERETVAQFLDWLAQGGWQRGLLRIEDFPGDGPLRIALIDELARRGGTHGITQTYTRAFFRPGLSADAYLERFVPGKKRKEFRRQQMRLAEHGPVEVAELQPLDDPRAWAQEFIELEQRGWKGQDNVSVASREVHLRYFSELVRHAALRNRIMALSLRLDGKPIAMKLNLLSRGGSVAFKITYAEEWARYSPGVLLEIDNIHRLHRRDDVPWMDSCAAPNRAMINRLWGDRREMQTLLIAAEHPVASLVVSAMPLARWVSRRLRPAKPQEVSHEH